MTEPTRKRINKPVRRRKGLLLQFLVDLKRELESSIGREVSIVFFLGVALILFLSIIGAAGTVGDFLVYWGRYLIGSATYLLILLFLVLAYFKFQYSDFRIGFLRTVSLFLFFWGLTGLLALLAPFDRALDLAQAGQYGGMLGFYATSFQISLGKWGTLVVLLVVMLVGLIVSFNLSLTALIAAFSGDQVAVKIEKNKELAKKERLHIHTPNGEIVSEKEIEADPEPIEKPRKKKGLNIQTPADLKPVKKKAELDIKLRQIEDSGWQVPPLDILDENPAALKIDEDYLHKSAERIKDKLAHFGIGVEMRDAHVGPTVIQYTLKPAENVKLTKIKALADDLALALAAKAIRIEAPIPGKSLVGVELPNKDRILVRLREILESEVYDRVDSNLKLILGKDVSGQPIIGDLKKMPHLLIAGATGSGKSICINTFLLNLLYQNSPADLRLILVDPKRVELTPYNNIPHLLTPVITDPDKTIAALKWGVAEMTRRYKLFSEKGARNIGDFNKMHPDERIPYVIIAIDELADLMMAAPKEVEALICRIAQMARASGIHLIIATQRPSVDVITGLIKANIPTRIAFTVVAGTDSRTILDSVGAERLLGDGDMLYLPGDEAQPRRIQGVFVSNDEVKRVVNFIKTHTPDMLDYDDEVIKDKPEVTVPGFTPSDSGSSDDDLYEEAIKVIQASGKASASLLQRRLSVGYARAARLLDMLEENGVIGPANGAKPRDIYIAVTKNENDVLDGSEDESNIEAEF